MPGPSRAAARVWLAGHSSGGALCQLAALRLAAALPGGAHRIGGVLLFNADRVGSAAFSEHYDSLLGPRTLRFGYGLGAGGRRAGGGGGGNGGAVLRAGPADPARRSLAWTLCRPDPPRSLPAPTSYPLPAPPPQTMPTSPPTWPWACASRGAACGERRGQGLPRSCLQPQLRAQRAHLAFAPAPPAPSPYRACPARGRAVEALVELPLGGDRVHACAGHLPPPRSVDLETEASGARRGPGWGRARSPSEAPPSPRARAFSRPGPNHHPAGRCQVAHPGAAALYLWQRRNVHGAPRGAAPLAWFEAVLGLRLCSRVLLTLEARHPTPPSPHPTPPHPTPPHPTPPHPTPPHPTPPSPHPTPPHPTPPHPTPPSSTPPTPGRSWSGAPSPTISRRCCSTPSYGSWTPPPPPTRPGAPPRRAPPRPRSRRPSAL
jgi:hypothetical protein